MVIGDFWKRIKGHSSSLTNGSTRVMWLPDNLGRKPSWNNILQHTLTLYNLFLPALQRVAMLDKLQMSFNFVIEATKGKLIELILFPSTAAAMFELFVPTAREWDKLYYPVLLCWISCRNGGLVLWSGLHFQEFLTADSPLITKDDLLRI